MPSENHETGFRRPYILFFRVFRYMKSSMKMGRKAGFAAECSLIFNYIAIDMKSCMPKHL
ncbi:hypothetical protein [Neisseria polysaccharea]|uniref:hypothetical protein n=1 Tax=Neisseria polysaccharea TaxID=489 RepID=UPI0027DEBE6D|nr:hypothetical protein [Neisseria polysaccharea]